MESTLIDAIRGCKVIEFYAFGRHRIGEPHLLGVEDDEKTLELFQTGGSSRSGGLSEWRHFHLSTMEGVVIAATTFRPRSDFNPDRRRWSRIIQRV